MPFGRGDRSLCPPPKTGRPAPIAARGKPHRLACLGLTRLLVVVLDQMRTGNAKFARAFHRLLHQFFVGHVVE